MSKLYWAREILVGKWCIVAIEGEVAVVVAYVCFADPHPQGQWTQPVHTAGRPIDLAKWEIGPHIEMPSDDEQHYEAHVSETEPTP